MDVVLKDDEGGGVERRVGDRKAVIVEKAVLYTKCTLRQWFLENLYYVSSVCPSARLGESNSRSILPWGWRGRLIQLKRRRRTGRGKNDSQ